jgi:hypothetical protein
VVSTVTHSRSLVRNAPLSCATRRLSASKSSSLSPSRFLQWLRSERSCGKMCWKNSSPVKYWKIGVVNPSLAHPFVGKAVDVLEQQPEHKPCRDPRPALVAIERRDSAIEPIPRDLARERHQLVLHVDDLIEAGSEQIARTLVSCFFGRILPSKAAIKSRRAIRGNPKNEIASFKRLLVAREDVRVL